MSMNQSMQSTVAEVPLDAALWSAGERLLLLQAIEHFGPHAWGSIAKAVRSAASRMTEHTRPAGFFSTANCKDLFEQISLQHANLDAYATKLRAAFLDELHRRLPQLEIDAIQLHRSVALLPEPDNLDAYAPEPSQHSARPVVVAPPSPVQSVPPIPVVKQQPIDEQPAATVSVSPPPTAADADDGADSPVAKKARTRASPPPPPVKVEVDEPPAELEAADASVAAAAVVAAAAPVDDGTLPVVRRGRRRSADSSRVTSRHTSRATSRATSPSPDPTAAATAATTTTSTSTVTATVPTGEVAVAKRSTPHRAAAPQSDPLANALRTVMHDERAKWFMDAVDASVVPTYSEVIREPMHLRAIAEALEQNPKLPAEHVWAALLHVFYNAFVFNSPGSEIFQSAHELRCIAAGLMLPHLSPEAAAFARALVALSPVHNADGDVVELKKPKEKRKR